MNAAELKVQKTAFQDAFKLTKDYKFYRGECLEDSQIFRMTFDTYRLYCVQQAWCMWVASYSFNRDT